MLVTTTALKINGKPCDEDEIEVEIDLDDIHEQITSFIVSDGECEIREVGELDYDSVEANAIIDAFKMRQPDLLKRCQNFLEDLTGRTV